MFIDLLSKMARCLDYDFDKVRLKRGMYYPNAHGKEQLYQQTMKKYLEEILSGEKPIPVQVVAIRRPDTTQKELIAPEEPERDSRETGR